MLQKQVGMRLVRMKVWFKKGASYGSLNTARSAISLISLNSLTNDALLSRFFVGIFHENLESFHLMCAYRKGEGNRNRVKRFRKRRKIQIELRLTLICC